MGRKVWSHSSEFNIVHLPLPPISHTHTHTLNQFFAYTNFSRLDLQECTRTILRCGLIRSLSSMTSQWSSKCDQQTDPVLGIYSRWLYTFVSIDLVLCRPRGVSSPRRKGFLEKAMSLPMTTARLAHFLVGLSHPPSLWQ